MCDDLGITLVSGDPTDKRSMASAEVNNKHLDVTMKAILMETNLPTEYWGDAITEAGQLRSLYPSRRAAKSCGGDAARPIEILTCGRIDHRECDARLRHRPALWSPCMVYRKGHKQTEWTCRWGIAMGMCGDL